MQIIAVGQPLDSSVTEMPEITEYNYRGGHHVLLLSMKNLCQQEIEAVNIGETEFGLYCQNRVIFFLYRFGEVLPWSDAAFSWWNLRREDRELPSPPAHPEERAVLNIILAEATNGTVKALRVVTLSPRFTRELHEQIILQSAGEPINREEFVAAAFEVYQHLSPSELAANAIVRTRGGD